MKRGGDECPDGPRRGRRTPGVSADDVDPGADLIASGLDSIRMMSLSGRWRKQGINVGFAALAANPTVAAWIELVAEHTPDAPAEESAAETGDAGDDGEPFRSRPSSTPSGWAGTRISS